MKNLPPEAVEIVNLVKGNPPEDYHCHCPFCQKYRGLLVRPDGSFYSKTVRRKYYTAEESNMESSHVAKTPVHLARWAIQQFTKPGDWVLDPTIGAGTTGVEALTHGRKAAGVELEFGRMARNNLKAYGTEGQDFKLFDGDARELTKFLNGGPQFSLIVNNPPYSGDEHGAPIKNKDGVKTGRYQKNYDRMLTNNIAFLKEGDGYYRTIGSVYAQAWNFLKPGGRFVIGVKDMMRQRKHYPLHQFLGEAFLAAVPSAEFVGTVILPHWPRTLGISAYEKRYGIKPALYQTILVFRKRVGEAGDMLS
jgi:DNA modification methylase